MDTGAWILAAVILVLLTLWIISMGKGSTRRRRAAHPEGRPSVQVREDHRTFRRDELTGSDGL
ncbi:hypothetical protein [Georgenia sp. SUBG003]|uniref:hypothetical protein n=1 Tax=Georgenia sp. SUBG003 TaxID=1497974 RepID=UPI0004D99E0B|nr:hypothetical protein DA06_08110 [Georgenia sp. SUBG003]